MINYAFYRTKYGFGGLISEGNKLLRVYLPTGEKNGLEKKIKKDFPTAKPATSVKKGPIAGIFNELERYFQGENISFTCELDLSKLTDFEQRILKAARSIPHAETRSYDWVAREAGFPEAFRAAGSVLGKNPWPIIVPCHRVVKSDGSLGGWSGEPGWKERLQQLEKSGC